MQSARLFVDSQEPSANVPYASPYSLEVLNIKPAGTGSPAIPTNNRIFRAYPGIEYNIRAAIRGGSYPYTCALSGQPSGMTVDADTCEVSWPSPDTTTGTITLTVTDAIDAEVTAQWAVTVGTSDWHFVDEDYTGTSDGSITQPWETLLEAVQNTSTGDILVFRDSTSPYTVENYAPCGFDGNDGPGNDGNTGTDEGSMYIAIGECSAANIWLAYPGESPVIDAEGTKFLRSNYMYIDGLTFQNGREYMWKLLSSSNYMTIRRSVFDGVLAATATNRNQGFMFTVSASTGQYFVVQNNEFTDYVSAQAIGSLYNCDDYLISDNSFHDGGTVVGGLNIYAFPFGIKESNSRGTIRGNLLQIPASAEWVEVWNHPGGEELDFSYNTILRLGGNTTTVIFFEQSWDGARVFRNTFKGDVDLDIAHTDLSFENNVVEGSILNTTGNTVNNNLVAAYDSGMLDSNGHLTEGYAEYVGTRGAQIP